MSDQTILSDAKLLAQLCTGDDASFETLLLRHYERIYTALFCLLGQKADAEDIAQQVFLKLYHAPERIRLEDDETNVAGWLYRAALNEAYNALRSQKRRTAWQERFARLWPSPPDPVTYATFVAQVADRYRGKIQAIEVWFWPNIWFEVGGRGRMNAVNYVHLLQQSYQAIKATNSEVVVISGAMSPAGNVGDMATDDVDYLRQMYINGVKDYFDVLGANPSGYNCPALADWQTVTPEEAGANPDHGLFRNRHHSWCFLGTMEAYLEVMAASGDIKPIAITEFGWGVSSDPQTGYEYTRDNTPTEQAQWIIEAYQWAKEQQGWVGPTILGNLDYGVTQPDNWRAPFGILNTPAYEAPVKMPK